MIFSGGFCFLDLGPGILQGIIINTWVANPLLSRDLTGESEKYTTYSQVLVSAQSLVNCVALLHAASLLGTSIFSFLKWSQHYLTNSEESKEKIHVKQLYRL